MRFVVQRVSEARVKVEDEIIAGIEKGFLVLIGISEEDTHAEADRLVNKLLGLRIFEDNQGKTNLALHDVGGSLLLVSQFTLYADCKKGNRPSFINAARPEKAIPLYEYIIEKCREKVSQVGTGIFGAYMQVELVNDGPFTVIIDSKDI